MSAERPRQPAVDVSWLAQREEAALEPALPIIDAHHHLWELAGYEYLADDLLADVSGGHNIEATIFVQCGYKYRTDGPEGLRPVGETEHIAALARAADQRQDKARICAAIIGHADLRLGEQVSEVLEAHIAAADGRFRGIRQNLARDAALTRHLLPPPPEQMAADPAFRQGFAQLQRFGLSFDAWVFHPQIAEIADLARAFPGTPIILNHMGGLMGIGPYAGRRGEIFQLWAKDIRALAQSPNAHVKLGGFGLSVSGLDFHLRALPPSSAELAEAWRPYVETCIEAFGIERCMFESNFPVDKAAFSYKVFWNTCKLLAQGASADEKAALFSGNAKRFYRLPI